MLQSVRYGDENRGEVGLNRLINEGIVRAAFPLHDVSVSNKNNVTSFLLSLYKLIFVLRYNIIKVTKTNLVFYLISGMSLLNYYFYYLFIKIYMFDLVDF